MSQSLSRQPIYYRSGLSRAELLSELLQLKQDASWMDLQELAERRAVLHRQWNAMHCPTVDSDDSPIQLG